MENACVRYLSGCSSSWERLLREFTFRQESAQTIIETVISTQLRSWSRIRKNLQELQWLICSSFVWQRTTFAYWQGSSVCDCNNQSFPIQVWVWEESVQLQSKHGRRRLIGLWIHVNLANWIVSMGNRGNFGARGTDGASLEIFAEILSGGDQVLSTPILIWKAQTEEKNKNIF